MSWRVSNNSTIKPWPCENALFFYPLKTSHIQQQSFSFSGKLIMLSRFKIRLTVCDLSNTVTLSTAVSFQFSFSVCCWHFPVCVGIFADRKQFLPCQHILLVLLYCCPLLAAAGTAMCPPFLNKFPWLISLIEDAMNESNNAPSVQRAVFIFEMLIPHSGLSFYLFTFVCFF